MMPQETGEHIALKLDSLGDYPCAICGKPLECSEKTQPLYCEKCHMWIHPGCARKVGFWRSPECPKCSSRINISWSRYCPKCSTFFEPVYWMSETNYTMHEACNTKFYLVPTKNVGQKESLTVFFLGIFVIALPLGMLGRSLKGIPSILLILKCVAAALFVAVVAPFGGLFAKYIFIHLFCRKPLQTDIDGRVLPIPEANEFLQEPFLKRGFIHLKYLWRNPFTIFAAILFIVLVFKGWFK